MLGSDLVEKIINTILNQNATLFGSNPKVEKVNVGFTNTIYSIDDSFIVKICTNSDNENAFQKEIEFYKTNKTNNLIIQVLIRRIFHIFMKL